jgi:hypothetical protein
VLNYFFAAGIDLIFWEQIDFIQYQPAITGSHGGAKFF